MLKVDYKMVTSSSALDTRRQIPRETRNHRSDINYLNEKIALRKGALISAEYNPKYSLMSKFLSICFVKACNCKQSNISTPLKFWAECPRQRWGNTLVFANGMVYAKPSPLRTILEMIPAPLCSNNKKHSD